MSDYGQISIDLTGVTADSDTNLGFQIHGSTFTFGALTEAGSARLLLTGMWVSKGQSV